MELLKDKNSVDLMTELFSKFTPDEQKKIYENAVGKITDKNFNEYNLLNLKENYILESLNKINQQEIKNINCQSIEFFVERIKKKIKNICILGLVQSGKTNEIINLVYFCIRYLKIPVIIIIQNKTSGFKQLEERFQKFINKLKDCNFKVRYTKGIKTSILEKTFNYKNPVPEVIISLSNFKQLGNLDRTLKYIKEKNNNNISPYALFMDEYDELIKSRLDINELVDLSEKEKEFEKNRKKRGTFSIFNG